MIDILKKKVSRWENSPALNFARLREEGDVFRFDALVLEVGKRFDAKRFEAQVRKDGKLLSATSTKLVKGKNGRLRKNRTPETAYSDSSNFLRALSASVGRANKT